MPEIFANNLSCAEVLIAQLEEILKVRTFLAPLSSDQQGNREH